MAQLKQLARQIFHERLAAIDIPATMQRKLLRERTVLACGDATIDPRKFEKLRGVARAKAARAVAEGRAEAPSRFVRPERVASPPAAPIAVAVSDVAVGEEAAVASGPTLLDASTIGVVKRIVAEYSLQQKFPPGLRDWLDKGKMPETPKADAPAFRNAHFLLLLGMDDLFHPAHHAAEQKGFVACCDNTTEDWTVEKAAGYLLGQLEELRKINSGRRVAFVADGEVRSPEMGNGNCRREVR